MVVDPDIACNIMTSIGKLNSKENFSDFTVIVEGKEFRCHRFLLNACSGFFNALLRSGMKEATEHSVAVHGISSDVFSIILNCLYKGENVITRDNVIELWHAANLLQINFLVQECEKYIVDKLIPEDTHEVYAHAKLLDSNGVVKSVINLIAKDFERYSSTSIFLQLYPEDILTLVKHEELFVSSEDLVINAILKWASHCEVIEHGDNTGQRSIEDDSSREEILLDHVSHSETDTLGLDISKGCSIFDAISTAANSPKESNEQESTSKATITNQISHEDKSNAYTSSKVINRQQCLGQLLSACRTCLVSTDCLETLLNCDMIIENKDALSAVRKAILYQFKPGPWSSMAIHRPTSHQENVVIFLEKKFLKAYSVQQNKTFYISELPEGADSGAGLSVINDQMFLLMQNQKGRFYSSLTSLFVFISPNSWTQVLENTIFQHNFALLNNFIYWITESKICRINVNLMLCNESIPAEIVLPLSVERIFIVKNTLAFGKKILFLCSEDQLANSSVLCLDTQNLKVSRHILDGSGGHIISFQDESHTYLLFQDGTLQTLVDCPDGGVGFQFLTKLWGFTWDVRGAVVFERQLYLFGNYNRTVEMLNIQVSPGQAVVFDDKDANSLKTKWPWSASLPGYFDKVNIIFVDGRSKFFPFVIPKKWMSEKLSAD